MPVTFDNIEFHFVNPLRDEEKNRVRDLVRDALQSGEIVCERCDHANAFVYVDDPLRVNGTVNVSCDCGNIERSFTFGY